MKFLIASDIHGSKKYCQMLLQAFDSQKADRLLLLGDLYYNGARNDPPEEYAPKEVVKLLNAKADKIIAVKGNCESEVDSTVSHFPISDLATVFAFNKVFTLTHGHHYSFDNLPVCPGDVFIQGHTHISVLEKRGELILANPGSVSLPKDEQHSYLVADERGMVLINLLTCEVLKELEY